jgi:hypothetical protein
MIVFIEKQICAVEVRVVAHFSEAKKVGKRTWLSHI